MTLQRRVPKLLKLFAIIAVLAMLVAACGGDSTSTTEEETTTTAGETSTTGGEETTTSAASMDTRWGMTEDEELAWQEVEAAAAEEGTLVYYSVGSVPADRVDVLLDAFAEDYPDIEIQYLSAGNNAAIVGRVTTEQESGAVLGDVVDMSFGNALRLDPEFFLDFAAPAAGDPEADWAFEPTLLSDDGRAISTGMMAQYFGLWYNTDLVSAEEAPKNYMDLTDPKWSGVTIARQFWNTGGGNHTYTAATMEYGEAWVEGMQQLDLTFGADQDEALLALARGEFALAVGLTGRQATQLIAEGLPIMVSWPEDISLRVTNSIIIQNNAPHPNAAKVFANWMITQRGQEMWQELGQFPVNKNVPPSEEWMQGFADSEISFENLTQGEELEANLAKAQAEFEN